MSDNLLLLGFDNWEACARYWHQRTHESQTAHILILKKYHELQRELENWQQRHTDREKEVEFWHDAFRQLSQSHIDAMKELQSKGQNEIDINSGQNVSFREEPRNSGWSV